MLAAVFEGTEKINLREVPTPEVGDGDLLLRVRAATICGTDLKIVAGKKTRGVRIPSILGHEIAGEIIAVGAQVAGWRAGEFVAVAPVIACGECYYCGRDLENLCARRKALGYEYEGGFAEFLRVPAPAVSAGNVLRLPTDLSCQAAALSEPLSCCINGQDNMGGIKPGDTVLIIGAGPIGTMHMQLAKAVPQTRVIVSETLAQRRRMALENGADAVHDPDDTDIYQRVMDETSGLGADKIILAVGIADLVNHLLCLTRKNGAINLFAGFSAGAMARLDINEIHYRQIRISGASASTTSQFKRALDLIAAGAIDAGALVSERFSLERFPDAWQCARAGQGLKVAIIPDGRESA
ncbi:MAG: alcohol dehydrogenase catalytic domain-containing protein [Chloroflexi bacterium]|nr:alcohol dehydrogenase catalytic domain-containing protein [Chloroflexota bacterium]